jgi:hypothetical protein
MRLRPGDPVGVEELPLVFVDMLRYRDLYLLAKLRGNPILPPIMATLSLVRQPSVNRPSIGEGAKLLRVEGHTPKAT